MKKEMIIIEKKIGDITIAEISGMISGVASAQLKQHIRNLLDNGCKKLVLELSDVNFMDSTGVGALISALTSFRRAQGELVLAGLSEQLRMLFELLRLHKVIPIYASEVNAVTALEKETA